MRLHSLFPFFVATGLVASACVAEPDPQTGSPEPEQVSATVPFVDEQPTSTIPVIEPRSTALELTKKDVVDAIVGLGDRPKTVRVSWEQQVFTSDATVTGTIVQTDDDAGNMYQVADSTEIFNEVSATLVGWSVERNRQLAELPEDEQPFEDWTPVSIAVASNGATQLHAKTVNGQSWIRYDAMAGYQQGQAELFAKFYQPDLFVENPNYVADTYRAIGFDPAVLMSTSEMWLPIDLGSNREFPQIGSESVTVRIEGFVEEQDTTLGPVEFVDGRTSANLYFGESDEVEIDLAEERFVPHLKVNFDDSRNIIEMVEAFYGSSKRYEFFWDRDESLLEAPAKDQLMTLERLAIALDVEVACIEQFDLEWLNPADVFHLCSDFDPDIETGKEKFDRIAGELTGTTVPEE